MPVVAEPKKPYDLIDRESEWARLVEEVESPGPGLVLVTGRRRSGKSYLLTRFTRAARGAYYQATKKTEREQLLDLSRVLGERFDDPALRHSMLSDWDALLEYVTSRADGKPFVLVLDEFPYLADAAPALPSILQRWWDHRLADQGVTLVLSGSHVTAMKRLVQSDQPLYGRRTARLDIHAFDYLDAAEFARDWEPKDRLRLYAVFGGLPGHLSLVRPEQSLAENVSRLILDPSGRLHDEAAHAFDAFLSDAAVHYSVVEAIASGEQRWSRIASRIGRQTSALSRPLEWLLDMGVVEKVAPVTEYPRPSPKRTVYRLSDPYLAFWHRFVADLKGRGLTSLVDSAELWRTSVAPRLDENHVAHVFEQACRQFVARGVHPDLPFRPVQVGSWWSRDSSEEVDVVALDGRGHLLVGACKWGRVDSRDLDRLKRRGQLVANEATAVKEVTHVLFSAGGLDREVSARVQAGEAIHLPLEALYAPWPSMV
ncbi:MAG: AAA+ ATPase superfamily predicted ATPase [Rhodothermales bacterium]